MNALSPINTRQTVEVMHDLICPWCYLGTRRLLTTLEQRPLEQVSLFWRPFLLNPDLPAEGVPHQDYVLRKYGGKDRAQRLYTALERLGAGSGITFRFERITHVPSSVDAHRLALWAADEGLGTEAVTALFSAFFNEGRNIGNHGVLASVAAAIGLDPQAARRMLREDGGLDRMRLETFRAHRRGIGGVPSFVFGRGVAVSGAQEPEVLSRLLDVSALEPASR